MNHILRIPLQFSLPSIQEAADFLSSVRALEQKTLRVAIPIFRSISEAAFRVTKELGKVVFITDVISLCLLLVLGTLQQFECPDALVDFFVTNVLGPSMCLFVISLVAASIFFATMFVSFGTECILYRYALERIAGLPLEELDQSLLRALLDWRDRVGRGLPFLETRSLEVFREMRNSFGNRLPQDLQRRLGVAVDEFRGLGLGLFGNVEQPVARRPMDLHIEASLLRLDYRPDPAFACRVGENPVTASFVPETFVENTRNRACTYSSFSREIEGVAIGEGTFRSLFRRMEEKHGGLLNNESAVAEEVTRDFSDSYSLLKGCLCNNDVSRMLLRGGEGQTVTVEYLQLHSILRYIFSLSDQVEPTVQQGFFSFFVSQRRQQRNGVFSLRERVLLSLASSVQGCVSGKKSSIAAFYNQLPLEFKRQESRQASEMIQDFRVKELVYQTLMKEVAIRFDSFSPFMKERLGLSNLPPEQVVYPGQLAHQTIFLKNLIGARVGLPGGIQGDPYEEIASSNLYGGDLSAALNDPEPLVRATLDSFYRDFTPGPAIAAIKKELAGQGVLLGPISDLIEEYLQGENPREQKYLEVDEDSGAYHYIDRSTNQVICKARYSEEGGGTSEVTDYGVFLLLKALGYLA